MKRSFFPYWNIEKVSEAKTTRITNPTRWRWWHHFAKEVDGLWNAVDALRTLPQHT